MSRRGPLRVVGIYPERGKWQIVLVEDAGAEALRAKVQMERGVACAGSRKLGDVLPVLGEEIGVITPRRVAAL